MDLTKEFPRSPRERLAGLNMLARTIDKARAKQADSLGPYIFDCSMDRRLFEALRTDGDEFFAVVAETEDDARVVSWLSRTGHMPTGAVIDALNADIDTWAPKNDDARARFERQRDEIAPGRRDVQTWTDLIDLEEGRLKAR
jgi:hypothetical protein